MSGTGVAMKDYSFDTHSIFRNCDRSNLQDIAIKRNSSLSSYSLPLFENPSEIVANLSEADRVSGVWETLP